MRPEKDRRSGRGRPDLARYYVLAILGGRKNASLFCGCLFCSLNVSPPSSSLAARRLPRPCPRYSTPSSGYSSKGSLIRYLKRRRALQHQGRAALRGKPVLSRPLSVPHLHLLLSLLVAYDKLSTTNVRSSRRREKDLAVGSEGVSEVWLRRKRQQVSRRSVAACHTFTSMSYQL